MDIHSMPAIAKMFALPKMHKYPHRIVLIEKAETLAAFQNKPDKITILTLTEAGTIEKIGYWDPVREPIAGYLQRCIFPFKVTNRMTGNGNYLCYDLSERSDLIRCHQNQTL